MSDEESVAELVARLQADEAAEKRMVELATLAYDEASARTQKGVGLYALLRGVEAPSPGSPSPQKAATLENPVARDRRTVLFSGPCPLKGLRRVTWDVMFEAGEAGLTNAEFR